MPAHGPKGNIHNLPRKKKKKTIIAEVVAVKIKKK